MFAIDLRTLETTFSPPPSMDTSYTILSPPPSITPRKLHTFSFPLSCISLLSSGVMTDHPALGIALPVPSYFLPSTGLGWFTYDLGKYRFDTIAEVSVSTVPKRYNWLISCYGDRWLLPFPRVLRSKPGAK